MKDEENKGVIRIKEIAKRAKMGMATVDRVIHNRPGVSKKTRDKINFIIKELDYKPNLLARRLASKKIYHFAILIPGVSDETAFWEAPLKGIERAEAQISHYGVRILKYFFDLNDKTSFVKQANLILKKPVDGILAAPSFIQEAISFTKACKARNIPYVFINSDIPNHETLFYFGPHLFQSGYLAGHLIKYGISDEARILIVNISKEIDTQHHLIRIEEGFRAYFKDKKKNNRIVKVDIKNTDYQSIEKNLVRIFRKHPGIKAIFATNSRVSYVARYIEKAGMLGLIVVGFDFLEENINYLKKGMIDFLICQKPEEQGYKAILALYEMLILGLPVEQINYMANDVITKENYVFYHN
jgi:LacI family transcriptional regulator